MCVFETSLQSRDRIPRRYDGGGAGDVAISYVDAGGWRLAIAAGGDRRVEAECFVDDGVERGEGGEGAVGGCVDSGKGGVEGLGYGRVKSELIEEENEGRGDGVAWGR